MRPSAASKVRLWRDSLRSRPKWLGATAGWLVQQCGLKAVSAATTERGLPYPPKTCAQNEHKACRTRLCLNKAIAIISAVAATRDVCPPQRGWLQRGAGTDRAARR